MAEPTNDKQTLPKNWNSDGLSQGKPTGPVRPTEDANRDNKGKK
jgi:hypothetical protein